MKLLYLDLETTGLNPNENAIIELSGILEVNEKPQESFSIYMRPDTDQIINSDALNAIGLDLNTIERYPSQEIGYSRFIKILEKYVNPYDKNDKLFLVGYNIHGFDVPFLRNFFERNHNKYFGSYFYHPSIDVMLLASYFSMRQRDNLPNFKLPTIAKSLGISVDDARLHSALYDVTITRDIFLLIRQEYVC
jgi:DNA polymerase-3 subunit epsilon